MSGVADHRLVPYGGEHRTLLGVPSCSCGAIYERRYDEATLQRVHSDHTIATFAAEARTEVRHNLDRLLDELADDLGVREWWEADKAHREYLRQVMAYQIEQRIAMSIMRPTTFTVVTA